MAIGHVCSHTTSHAQSEETWDASCNQGKFVFTEDHFAEKNVSWGLFFSTLKSCRPSPEEKIKIDRDALKKNLIIDPDGEVEDAEEEEETMKEEEEELTKRGGINPLRKDPQIASDTG
ncbi:hypothetical protein V1478_005152 [Vespula squamosa]|uniref:Uncharacterized protein n=1 Tax=Vespula squamosa TaxID=30214 RepID=A0ABD2BDH6_VESSQ